MESNWTLAEGVTWNTTGNEPGTAGSNMWGLIAIDTSGAVVSGVTLEGWKPQISITNGASATLTLGKIQAQDNTASFTVGIGSSLTLNVNGPYKDGQITYNVEVAGSLTVAICNNNALDATSVFNWGSHGSAMFSSSSNHTLGSSGSASTINATLVKAIEGVAGDTIYTRTLIELNNVAFSGMTYNFGEGWTQVASVDDITEFNQYALTSDASGIRGKLQACLQACYGDTLPVSIGRSGCPPPQEVSTTVVRTTFDLIAAHALYTGHALRMFFP